MANSEKLSVSLPRELLDYVDEYRLSHDVPSRSHVLAIAITALRNEELIASYKQSANDADDPLLDGGVCDGLEPSTEDNW